MILKNAAKFLWEHPLIVMTVGVTVFVLFHLITGDFSTVYPETVNELKSTSVKVVRYAGGGGSGVILSSSSNESIILTNKHVCAVVKNGGFIEQSGKYTNISEIKEYPLHDLCLVKVKKDLNVNTVVAHYRPLQGDKAIVSGHPALLPHIVARGEFTDYMIIPLVTGLKPCKDNDQNPACIMFGVMPIIEFFDSQIVSSLIRGGNSGSAVFNERGEISGVVFAGIGGGLSHGFIVPHGYVKDFVDNQDKYLWIKVGADSADNDEVESNTFTNCSIGEAIETPNCNLLWEEEWNQ